jgi:hypothetical protein
MQKVLPGASREALGFMRDHWKYLVKISVLPICLMVFAGAFYGRSPALITQLGGKATLNETALPDLTSIQEPSTLTFWLYATSIFFSLSLWFFQLVRFQRFEQARRLPMDSSFWKAFRTTVLYCFGLTALVVGTFQMALTALNSIAKLLLDNYVAESSFVILFSAAVLIALLWLTCRFLVGIAGVAFGHRPHFLFDLWPLAKGESWGLPLRVIGAVVIGYACVSLWLLMMIILFPPELTGADGLAAQQPGTTVIINVNQSPGLMGIMTTTFLWFLFSLLICFLSLLLGIAFRRFRDRDTVPSAN